MREAVCRESVCVGGGEAADSLREPAARTVKEK